MSAPPTVSYKTRAPLPRRPVTATMAKKAANGKAPTAASQDSGAEARAPLGRYVYLVIAYFALAFFGGGTGIASWTGVALLASVSKFLPYPLINMADDEYEGRIVPVRRDGVAARVLRWFCQRGSGQVRASGPDCSRHVYSGAYELVDWAWT